MFNSNFTAMSKKTKPAHAMGTPAGELPEETKSAIEAAAEQAETETPIRTMQADPAEVRELRREVEQLRAQVAKAPQSLDEQINYFQRKQQLVSRLNSLNSSILTLEKHGEEVRKEAEEDVFSSEVYALRLSSKKGYSSEEEVFKFRNPTVITELLNFVLSRMIEKREAIENEIIS